MSSLLPRSYFEHDTLGIARSLLGKSVVRTTEDGTRVGRIIEVEAYIGVKDRACHASRGRTPRTAVMFGPPGVAYVYLVYGMHYCFNIVTEREGYPAAVLVRAVEDETGLIDGPGRFCRQFQIDRSLNGIDLTVGTQLWVEDRGKCVMKSEIGAFPRVGVEYAGRWAAKPWRFRIKSYMKASPGRRRTAPRS